MFSSLISSTFFLPILSFFAVLSTMSAQVEANPLITPPPPPTPGADPHQQAPLRFYISGYDGTIRHFDFQPGLGAKEVGILNLTDAVKPSWLEFGYASSHLPRGRCLNKVYAVDESDQGRVLAFDVDHATGNLTLKDEASTGAGPVTLTTTRGGGGTQQRSSCLLSADYTAGSVSIHPLRSSDGSFEDDKPVQTLQFNGSGPITSRQDHSYAHQAILDPSGRFVYVADLGADQIHIISVPIEEQGTDDCTNFKLVQPSINLPAGSGPRHLTFHTCPLTRKTNIYLASELSNTITAFTQNPHTGQLEQVGQPLLVLPPGTEYSGYTEDAPNVGEVAVTPDGRFVLVSTRNSPDGVEDHIALFRRCKQTGELTWVEWFPTEGKTVRHFSLSTDAEAKFVLAANQGSGSAIIFSRDLQTGALKKETLITDIGMPAFAQFV
ncbi:hypothetical protein A4X09_0g4011 [Tilletia walkeri]|uniref:6-phosphogluconolactonase n=1 Tax=Tilletia walkeri TaxID=117179 RepID=A0A8X7N8K3_9BASI|nr:hypothetical protein A4X09_0g4011 [Tilletia walkeri]